MTEIRLLKDQDMEAFVPIFTGAYPGAGLVAKPDQDRFKERIRLLGQDPSVSLQGLFRQGTLQGIMALYDFSMNFRGHQIPVGGLGQLAVHLLHKKEHVAKEMITHFLWYYRKRGYPLVTLYAFRPDFYTSMGFGYGPKTSQYRIKPASFPKGPGKSHLCYLGPSDQRDIVDCYERVTNLTHGMMKKTEWEMQRLFRNPEHQIVGYRENGHVLGYMVYTFGRTDSFVTNDMHIHEWIYETPDVLLEFTTFLHTQADQIRHIIVDTQDSDFHYLLHDPRNGSERIIPSVYHESNSQGVGFMFRIIDIQRFFESLTFPCFGHGTCTIKIDTFDGFFPENTGSIILRFDQGTVQHTPTGSPDAQLRLSIGHLSSLLAGTVRFGSLWRYGLVTVSNPECVQTLGGIFATEHQPRCTTAF